MSKLLTARPLDVLLIDDEFVQLESLRRKVQGLGHRVAGAYASVREALQHLRSRPAPQVVICDVFFHGAPAGYELFCALQAKPGVKTILVSGAEANALSERLPPRLAAGTLLKPVREKELFLRLEAAAACPPELGTDTPPMATLEVRWRGRRRQVPIHMIVALESSGNEVIVHTTDDQRYVLREPLYKLLADLGERDFCRVHRGYAIHLRHVESYSSRTVTVTVLGELPIGRSHYAAFKARMREEG